MNSLKNKILSLCYISTYWGKNEKSKSICQAFNKWIEIHMYFKFHLVGFEVYTDK